MNARYMFAMGLLLVTLTLAWSALPIRAGTITVVNTNDSGSGSLRQAIADADPGDTIMFNFTYPATITLTSGQLTIGKNLTIAGPGASKLIVSGGNVTRTFHIQGEASATISGLAMANGYADDGGSVYNEGELTLTGCLFSGSHVLGNGGGAYSEGQLTVSGCTFSGNRADNDGGGIFNSGGTLTVTNSTFSGNAAGNNSGGLGSTFFGIATVTACVFSSNSAGNDGGGIGNDWTALSVANSTFSNNTAANNGGGIYSFGSLIADQGIFFSNNAANDGGGIASYDTLTITASTLSGNSAGNLGGGIANYGLLSLTGSTFSGNRADGEGGGIGNQGDADVVNSTFVGNSADVDGGGIYATFGATATVQNTIVGNSTSGGNCSGLLTEGGSQNLATDETCSPGFTQVTPAQLALGALTGSPAYFLLNPDSVAIDAGTNTGCPATDQRGVSRPQDGDGDGTAICDVGSYEALWLPRKVYLPLIKKS